MILSHTKSPSSRDYAKFYLEPRDRNSTKEYHAAPTPARAIPNPFSSVSWTLKSTTPSAIVIICFTLPHIDIVNAPATLFVWKETMLRTNAMNALPRTAMMKAVGKWSLAMNALILLNSPLTVA